LTEPTLPGVVAPLGAAEGFSPRAARSEMKLRAQIGSVTRAVDLIIGSEMDNRRCRNAILLKANRDSAPAALNRKVEATILNKPRRKVNPKGGPPTAPNHGGEGKPTFLQKAAKRGSDRSSRVNGLSIIAMTPGSCFS
jgi:hypothetical protein